MSWGKIPLQWKKLTWTISNQKKLQSKYNRHVPHSHHFHYRILSQAKLTIIEITWMRLNLFNELGLLFGIFSGPVQFNCITSKPNVKAGDHHLASGHSWWWSLNSMMQNHVMAITLPHTTITIRWSCNFLRHKSRLKYCYNLE